MTLPINYVELESDDFVRTMSFYKAACGWAFQQWGNEYISFSGAGVEGGFRKKGTSGKPGEDQAAPGSTEAAADEGMAGSAPRGGALVILHADDLEAAEATIRHAGGTITIPIFSFPGGRRFHFTDPTGNELAVWAEAPLP